MPAIQVTIYIRIKLCIKKSVNIAKRLLLIRLSRADANHRSLTFLFKLRTRGITSAVAVGRFSSRACAYDFRYLPSSSMRECCVSTPLHLRDESEERFFDRAAPAAAVPADPAPEGQGNPIAVYVCVGRVCPSTCCPRNT